MSLLPRDALGFQEQKQRQHIGYQHALTEERKVWRAHAHTHESMSDTVAPCHASSRLHNTKAAHEKRSTCASAFPYTWPLGHHFTITSLSRAHTLLYSNRIVNFLIMANSAFKSAMSNSKMRAMAKLSEISRLVSMSDTSEATVG